MSESDKPQLRQITREDIEFLAALQDEMNTQPHQCQADPRFWVVLTHEYREAWACEYENGFFNATGNKPKSRCMFRGVLIWTNCRECGHCLWEGWHLRGVSKGLVMDEGGKDE